MINRIHDFPVRSKFMRQLVEIMRQTQTRQYILTKQSGFSHNLLYRWRQRGYIPGVDNFEAVLNALGYRLEIVPLESDND